MDAYIDMYTVYMVSSVDGQHFRRAKLKLHNPTTNSVALSRSHSPHPISDHVALNCQSDADGQNKEWTKPFRAFRPQGRR